MSGALLVYTLGWREGEQYCGVLSSPLSVPLSSEEIEEVEFTTFPSDCFSGKEETINQSYSEKVCV